MTLKFIKGIKDNFEDEVRKKNWEKSELKRLKTFVGKREKLVNS